MRRLSVIFWSALAPLAAACTLEIKPLPDGYEADGEEHVTDGESSSGQGTPSSSGDGGSSSGTSAGSSSSGASAGASSSGQSGSSSGEGGASSSSGAPDGASSSGQVSTGDAFADEFVAAHNAARAADGVPPLAWDEEAATVARNYAAQCIFRHNANRGPFGENLFAGTGNYTPTAVTESWASEKQYYTYDTNRCALGRQCGHYTQVVWKNTTGLGCAKADCTTNSPFSGNGGRWQNWVCNYAPPGNYNGQRPF